MNEILLEIKNKKVQLDELQEALAIKARDIIEVEEYIVKLQTKIKSNSYEQLGFFASLFCIVVILLGVFWIRLCWVIFWEDDTLGGAIAIAISSPAFIVIYFFIAMMRSSTNDRNADKFNLSHYENKKNELSKSQDDAKERNDFFLLKGEVKSLEKKYFEKLVTHFTKIYDNNKNGELDILENSDDYMKLLQKNQDKIIQISEKMGVEYIDPLVKIDEKLKLKRESLNLTFKKIIEPAANYDDKINIEILEKYLGKEIQTYNIILTNSLFMASSLIANDRITFRRIYEKFDKLNMFNSNYENQAIKLLSNVNENLVELLTKIDNLNQSISDGIASLTYVTKENSNELTSQLERVNSSIDLNTLVTGINAYQSYKTNKNTKHLRL